MKLALGRVRVVREAGNLYTVGARIAPFSVAVLAVALLGYGMARGDIASAYADPVSKIRAQDESVYANSALRMATEGGWLTPTFLGRLLLYKPPLLIWLSAFSVKCFGASLSALRAPALVAAAAATTLLFLWACGSRSPGAGWTCVLLLLANPMWYTFARLCYTDMLFAAGVAAALFTLHLDPSLARVRSRCVFAVCSAAGFLAKSVAGFIPLAIWLLFGVLRRGEPRPSLARVVQVCIPVLLLVAPWHVYQIAVHPQWFWADYVQVQLLGFGLQPPAQSTAEPQLWFYVKRVSIIDPILICFAVLAVPAFWRDLRQRKSANALLLAVWLVVVATALLTFRYRNLPYALNLVPPLALLGASYSPGGWWRILPLCAALAAKTVFAGAVCGLPIKATEPIPSAAPLRAYAHRGRPNELIIVSPDDEFYSSTLHLSRLRYAFIDPNRLVIRYAPHFAYLGITVTVEQFLRFDDLRGKFLERLRAWGVQSSEPLATSILAKSAEEIVRLADARPQSDFFLPSDLFGALSTNTLATHEVVFTPNGRIFLLARQSRAETAR